MKFVEGNSESEDYTVAVNAPLFIILSMQAAAHYSRMSNTFSIVLWKELKARCQTRYFRYPNTSAQKDLRTVQISENKGKASGFKKIRNLGF